MSDSPDNSNIEPGTGSDAPTVERPEYVAEKFWDPEAKTPRLEQLARSYNDLERLIGSRVGDLGAEARKKLAEAVPDALRGTWESELKSKLVEDPEFLTPLEEKWKGAHLKQVPESYAVPTRDDGYEYDPEHPLVGTATEFAKRHGLDQDGFAELMALGFEARREYETPPDVDQWKEAIPDIEDRAKVVYNRLQGVSSKHAADLVREVRTPHAFLALEALVKAAGAKTLPMDGNSAPQKLDQAALDRMMADPRYSGPMKDNAFIAEVEAGFRKLYGDRL